MSYDKYGQVIGQVEKDNPDGSLYMRWTFDDKGQIIEQSRVPYPGLPGQTDWGNNQIIEALPDIEFDRGWGKLPDGIKVARLL